MAIYNSIAIGKARKSAGNVRFSIWKGIPVASQKPTSVANPRTIKQLNARARLTSLVRVFRSIPALIDSMYQFRAVRKSAYNAFISSNNIVSNLPVAGSPPVAFLAASLFIIENQNVVTATLLASQSVNSVSFSFSNLIPNSDYSFLSAVGNETGEYGTTNVLSSFNSGGSGATTISVPSLFIAVSAATFVFCVLQNDVTGVKFSFKDAL